MGLRSLDLRGCDVGFMELQQLRQALPDCTVYS